MASDITVLSWNIRSLKAKLKKHKAAVLEIFRQHDIVLLQETFVGLMDDGREYPGLKIITEALSEEYTLYKLKDQTYRRRRERPQNTMYMTYFSSDSKGVAILINKPHTLLNAFCVGGDYAWVHVQIGDQKYTFVSVYYHKKYPDRICNLMLKIFNSFWTDGLDAFKHRLVIGGDFNTTLDPRLDTSRDKSHHVARRNRLKDFMSIVKLSDVWRKNNGERIEYTHKQSRLDYVFMLKNDLRYVTSCEILKNITQSDHSPVSLTLNYPSTDDREE